MSVSNLSLNGSNFSDKLDQLELVSPEVSSNPEEEDQSDRLCRSVLRESRFKANSASRKLFDSCVSKLVVGSPSRTYQKSDSNSPLSQRQVHHENDYSFFTKKIESTPTPSLTLPLPKKDRLTQRLSDQEFIKRKDLCRHGKITGNLITEPFLPDVSCVSLKKGMSEGQEEEFKKHEQNVNQEIELRTAMSPFAALGASSRRPIEVATEIVTHPVKRFCTQNPINEKICTQVGDLSLSVFNEGVGLIPDAIKKTIERAFRVYHDFIERKAYEYTLKFRIDKQDTRDFYSGGLDLSVKGIFKVASVSTRAYKIKFSPLPPLVSTGRIQYSEGYGKSVDCFVKAKEFEGILSKDLMVVQYHSGTTLNQGRSLKWFTPIAQGNKLSTIDQVMDKLALLSSWGERTHVTVAKIPAGESVKFLHGRAIGQISRNSLELVKGGGVQYRFYDFDPKWILETRKLPKL